MGRGDVIERCLVGLLVAILSARATAETSRLGSLPMKPGKAGFLMQAEIEVVAGNGYQPIHLTFSPTAGSFSRDRHLQVDISPHHYRSTELDFVFHQSIKIQQGSAKQSTIVYVPHYYPWEAVSMTIREDGREIDTGRRRFHLGNGLRTRFAEQLTTFGIIAPSDMALQDAPWKVYPDIRTLIAVYGEGPIPEDAAVKRLSHQAALQRAAQVQPASVQFRPIDEAALHDTWLGYSQLDVIIVAEPVLERIQRQQPDRFRHLRRWLTAGGNLWIYAAGTADNALDVEITPANQNKMLAPKGVAGLLNLKADNDTTNLIYEPWNGVQRESQQYSFRSSDKKLSKRRDVYQKLRNAKHPFTKTLPKQQIAAELGIAPVGMGRIVTIKSDDPFPGSFQFWTSLRNLHEDGQVMWAERMGIDVPRGNDNYWMWLIPSVGQPPVKSFVMLNTIFVILMGPVCYFFFRRRHRLYLLYFVAPSLALLVTGGLFAYALAADGTETKLRSRQVTWLDAANGCALNQSRQTYYGVLGSRGGLEFSDQAAVYPVRNTPAYQRYYHRSRSRGRGDLTITNDSQHFAGTFFPPRNQVQYLITEPRETEESLELSGTPGKDATVTSHLPYRLRKLVVRDKNGTYWRGENIGAEEPTALQKCHADSLGQLLGPEVLPPLGSVPMLQNNRRNRGGWGTGVQVSLLENRLEQWSRRLPQNAFVATAEIVDERLGVEDAIVLDSAHVIMGEIP